MSKKAPNPDPTRSSMIRGSYIPPKNQLPPPPPKPNTCLSDQELVEKYRDRINDFAVNEGVSFEQAATSLVIAMRILQNSRAPEAFKNLKTGR